MRFTGLLTRNSAYELSQEACAKRATLCDALAVSSIVANCTGVDTSKSKCLGLQELQEFLSDYQEEDLTENQIMELIMVRCTF